MATWLETDERQEVFVTLSACHDFLQRASAEIYYWKWVFIALHNAVQGTMVVALKQSDGFGPIRENIRRKWYKEYAETGTPPPIEEKLLWFLALYDKIKESGTLQGHEVSPYSPPGNQDWAMKKLNEIRNEYIHFTPKGWHLDLTDAPDLGLSGSRYS